MNRNWYSKTQCVLQFIILSHQISVSIFFICMFLLYCMLFSHFFLSLIFTIVYEVFLGGLNILFFIRIIIFFVVIINFLEIICCRQGNSLEIIDGSCDTATTCTISEYKVMREILFMLHIPSSTCIFQEENERFVFRKNITIPSLTKVLS